MKEANYSIPLVVSSPPVARISQRGVVDFLPIFIFRSGPGGRLGLFRSEFLFLRAHPGKDGLSASVSLLLYGPSDAAQHGAEEVRGGLGEQEEGDEEGNKG